MQEVEKKRLNNRLKAIEYRDVLKIPRFVILLLFGMFLHFLSALWFLFVSA